MNKSVKIAVECALAVLIVLVAWLTVRSVQKPVKFNKEVAARSQVAIQRLKDIRTLQVAFKSETGRFSPTMDSLKMFYESRRPPARRPSPRRFLPSCRKPTRPVPPWCIPLPTRFP